MKTNSPWRKALGTAGAVLAFALSTLLPFATASAAPAAGTVIGNQASATYTDGSGTVRTTTSNLVQTTVSQVKSFTLTANGARTAAGGQTVYYPHVITNTGNGTDNYTLVAPTTGGTFAHTGLAYYADADGNGVPDNAVALASTGAVAAGAQFRFVVAAVVPGSAALNATGTITVSANDTGGNTGSNTDTTTVAASAVTATKSMSVTSGASPSAGNIVVTLAYTNSGTSAATNLVLGDVLPTGMNYVAGSGRWSNSGTTALTDAAAGDPAGIDYQYDAGTRKVTASIASVAAGASAQLTFQVSIAGGLSPTNSALGAACTTAGCPALTTNTATFETATQAQTSSNSVVYMVLQTGSVVLNGSSSSAAAGASEPLVVASAAQGAVVTFNAYAWNNGNGTDTINISSPGIGTFPAGTTFQLLKADGTTPLLDTNGDGVADTGPVAAGSNTLVVIKATLPTSGGTGDNGGAGYSATFAATSVYTPTATESATLNLGTIVANAVDATIGGAYNAGTPAAGQGATTTTVVATNNVTPVQGSTTSTVFSVYVNNRGGAADSYDLSLQDPLPAGWSLTFRADGGAGTCATQGAALTNTGSIAAGGNRLVCAVVTVPSIQTGAPPGNTSLQFNAQSASTTGSNDAVTVRVSVQQVNAVTLSPNGMQQTYAAAAVTYNHVLSNIGNVAQTVTFAGGYLTNAQSAAGWTSTAYLDNGDGVLDVATDTLLAVGTTTPLAVGATQTIFVRVFAPASATSASPANVTTLTATYNTTATVSATDTTGITDGLLLVKEQATTACGTAPVPAAYSVNAIAPGAATAPGQCIGYRITGTNTTGASITAVQLSDTVPANTVLHTACGAPTGSAGVTVGGTATNGSTGTVSASIATLAPTASFSVTFCVQINP